MDKLAGNMESAIKHYQVASQSNSPTGKNARKEMALLDMPNNPGKYIQTQALLAKNGDVGAAVRNNSPVAVTRHRHESGIYR